MTFYVPEYVNTPSSETRLYVPFLHSTDLTYGYWLEMRKVANIFGIFTIDEGYARPAWFDGRQGTWDNSSGSVSEELTISNTDYWRLDGAGAYTEWLIPSTADGFDAMRLWLYETDDDPDSTLSVIEYDGATETTLATVVVDGSDGYRSYRDIDFASAITAGNYLRLKQTGGTPRLHCWVVYDSDGTCTSASDTFWLTDIVPLIGDGSSMEYVYKIKPSAQSDDRWTGGYAHATLIESDSGNCTETNVSEAYERDSGDGNSETWTLARGWSAGTHIFTRTANIDYDDDALLDIADTSYRYTFAPQYIRVWHRLTFNEDISNTVVYNATFPAHGDWARQVTFTNGPVLLAYPADDGNSIYGDDDSETDAANCVDAYYETSSLGQVANMHIDSITKNSGYTSDYQVFVRRLPDSNPNLTQIRKVYFCVEAETRENTDTAGGQWTLKIVGPNWAASHDDVVNAERFHDISRLYPSWDNDTYIYRDYVEYRAVGDTLLPVGAHLETLDEDGTYSSFDVTNYTVKVQIDDSNGSSVLDATPTGVTKYNASGGLVQADLSAAEVDAAGLFYVQFIVENTSQETASFPRHGTGVPMYLNS